MKGKVWLVGAGPSDAGLFTRKGERVLREAQVVVYDKLVGQGILRLIPPAAERIDVGKIAGNHPVPQHEINQILLQKALEGKRVVRLKGGDPFLFGRGGEELELLAEQGIPFEIVPGVTSAIAVPAYAGIPVTHRDFCSSVHIITGHNKQEGEPDIPYDALVKLRGTLVFLMGVGSLQTICAGLIAAGMDEHTPAAILERGTTAKQRRVVATVRDLYEKALEASIKPPSVIVVGEVCALAERMHWAEDRLLGGIRVVNVRPQERSSKLTELLEAQGAEVIEFPCIETREISPNAALQEALEHLERYEWIALTSPFGAQLFFEILQRERRDIRTLAGVRFAAIGSATAREIEQRGVLVEYMPDTYCAKALGEGLATRARGRILLARAQEGSPELCAALAGAAEFDDVAIYETQYGAERSPIQTQLVEEGAFDVVMLTSASTVHGFAQAACGLDLTKVRAVCIGEQTARVARELGMQVHVSEQATLESMVECLGNINVGCKMKER